MRAWIAFALCLTVLKAQDDFVPECQFSSDCKLNQLCINQQCVKDQIFPPSSFELVGSLLIALFVGLSQAGGIGGGAVNVPFLMIFFNLSMHKAVANSYLLMFGGAIGNFVQQCQQKTKYGTPSVNYDLVLITLPFLMCGAVIGVVLNRFFPESLVCLVLVYIVQDALRKTLRKYRQLVTQEKQESSEIIVMNALKNEELEMKIFTPNINEKPDDPQLINIHKQMKKLFPVETVKIILYIFIFILCLFLLRGGQGLDSIIGIVPCQWGYWLMNIVLFVCCSFFTKFVCKRFADHEIFKEKSGFNFSQFGEQKITVENAKVFTYYGILAGGIGGIAGIGGATVLTPVWLTMNMPPQRATASAICTIIFTSFTTFFTSLIAGRYLVEEIIYFGLLAFVSSFIIANIVSKIVSYYKKESIILGILIASLGFVLCLIPAMTIYNISLNIKRLYEFSAFC